MILRFVILGEPVPKGRARTRVVKAEARTFAQQYTPKATRAYEEKVALLARNAAAAVAWRFGEKDRFGICVNVFRTHEGAGGDADNYFKAIADAVNRAGNVWPDDRRVRDARVTLDRDATTPRVVVRVWRLGPNR